MRGAEVRFTLTFFLALIPHVAFAQVVNPAVNAPLFGCVEGRALRIVNGAPSCASTSPPTLSACGTATITTSATDFIGQVTLPAGLTSCTIVMTKLYTPSFVCVVQAQNGTTLSLGASTVGNNGTVSTLAVPFGLSVAAAKFGYICGPG